MNFLLLVAIILYAVCATWSFANSEKKDAAALLAALRLDDLRGQQQQKPHQCYSYAWYSEEFKSEVAQYMSRFSLIDFEDCHRGEDIHEGFCVLWLEFVPKNDAIAGGFEKRMKLLIERWVCYKYGCNTRVRSYPFSDRLYKGYAFAINQEQKDKLSEWELKRADWERAESARTNPPMRTKKSV